MTPLEAGRAMSETYRVVMEAVLGQGGITMRANHDEKLVSISDMSWILAHFETALRLVNDTIQDTLLREFNMASTKDLEQVRLWNTPCPPRLKHCLHTAFETRARSKLAAIAIDASVGGRWTYEQLNQSSSKLAVHLIKLGVKPKDKIPICFEKSAFALVAMLGILKAGGAYVPLDLQDADMRRKAILADINARIAVTGAGRAELTAEDSITCVAVDSNFLDRLPSISGGETWPATPDNTAYVLDTSGSTGKPKGVVLSHSSVLTSAQAHAEAMFIDDSRRIYQFTAYTFDVSVAETLTSLIQGSCVCVPSEEERLGDIAASMRNFKVNWAFFTPSVVNLLQPEAVPDLEILVLGVETVTKENAATWALKKTLVVRYGPSESCVFSSAAVINNPEQSSGWIGHSIGGQLWIVEPESTQLSPISCVGELVVSGHTLARHYLNDPIKTADAFIDDVGWLKELECDGQASRIYRTGDLARFNSDGTVTYLGRKDTQVKINGKRVELGEIEFHLSGVQDVRSAAVFFPNRGPWAKSLTAVIELNSGASAVGKELDPRKASELVLITGSQRLRTAMAVENIRDRLTSLLPSHMLPSAWVPVQAVPQNASRKLDRAKILQWTNEAHVEIYMAASRLSGADPDTQRHTRNDKEAFLRDTWAQVLNCSPERIGLDVPLTQFGGDSISAIQLATKARRNGLRLTAQDVLRSKSIIRLADLAGTIQTPTVVTRPAFSENGLPFELSPIQQMCFEAFAAPANCHFNQSLLLEITKSVNAQQIHKAIQTIVGRHAMLRARLIDAGDGRRRQVITEDITGSYEMFWKYGLADEEIQTQISSAQRRLDIVNGPVLSANVFQASTGTHLFLTAVHFVIDLVSWRVLLADLEQIFQSQYLDALSATSFHEWTMLQGANSRIGHDVASILPSPAPAPNYAFWGINSHSNTFGSVVDASLTIKSELASIILGPANDAFGSEALDIMIAAAFHSHASTYQEKPALAIFIEGHGREPWSQDLDVSETVGWFTTMVPISIREHASALDVVREVKDLRRSIPGRGRPYFASRYHTQTGRQAFGYNHEMEILFNYQGGYEQLENETAILRAPKPEFADKYQLDNVSESVRRPALIDIAIRASHGSLKVTFMWSRYMQHQSRLRQLLVIEY